MNTSTKPPRRLPVPVEDYGPNIILMALCVHEIGRLSDEEYKAVFELGRSDLPF